MAWRDLFPFLRTKSNPVSSIIMLGLGKDTPIAPRDNLRKQSEEGYSLNVTVFDCVNLISRSAAGIPWILMRKPKSPGGRPQKLMTMRTASKALNSGHPLMAKAARNSEIEDHPLLTVLERPNPYQGGAEYTEAVFAYWLVNGNSFETWLTPDTGPNKGRKPYEFWVLRPDRMTIKGAAKESGELVAGYWYSVGAESVPFDPSVILHQKFFSPLDDFYGLSPIQVAASIIDGDNAAVKWNRRVLQNDGRPSGALFVKDGMLEDDRTRFNAMLKKRMSGADNARAPIVFEGNVDWKQFGLSAIDLDWLEGRKFNRREIARAYNVPPELVGDTDVQGYASKEQARKALYEETVLPLMDRRRDNLNNGPVRMFGDDSLYLDYDRDQIEAIHEDMAKKFTGLRQADWISIQEKRAATGYDDYKGNPEVDDPVNVPVAFLKPAQLPGAPEDTGAAGDGTANPTLPGLKAVRLSEAQRRKQEAKLEARWRKRFAMQKRAVLSAIDKLAG